MGLHEACDLTVCRHGAMCVVEIARLGRCLRLAIDGRLCDAVHLTSTHHTPAPDARLVV